MAVWNLLQYPQVARPPPGAPRVEPVFAEAWMRLPEIPAAYFGPRQWRYTWPYLFFLNTFPAPPPVVVPDFGYMQMPVVPGKRTHLGYTWPSVFHMLTPIVVGATRANRLHPGTTTPGAAGVPAQLVSTSVRCKGYIFTGRATNAGAAYIGLADVAVTGGYSLVPGETLAVFTEGSVDPRDFYVTVDVAGDRLDWLLYFEV